jgi:hypothetical protein
MRYEGEQAKIDGSLPPSNNNMRGYTLALLSIDVIIYAIFVFGVLCI